MEENQEQLTEEQVAASPEQEVATTDEESKVNQECANVMTEIMNEEQASLDRLSEQVNRLQALLDQTHREDIKSAIQELKDLIIGDEAEHWDVAKEWYEFFAGIEPAEDPLDELNNDLDDNGYEDVEVKE